MGANSTSECLVWGGITGKLAAEYATNRLNKSIDILNEKVRYEEKRIFDGIFRGTGDVNPYETRIELTDMMDDNAYVFRNEEGLTNGLKKARQLSKLSWRHVNDKAMEYNTNFVNVMEIDSIFRVAEVILMGAIGRRESRGAHFRTDFPTRDDTNFLRHTLVYYNNGQPSIDWCPVKFTRYAPVERKY